MEWLRSTEWSGPGSTKAEDILSSGPGFKGKDINPPYLLPWGPKKIHMGPPSPMSKVEGTTMDH